MTKEELKFLGFTQKGDKDGYWYELRLKNHKFITCDNHFLTETKGKWIVGYSNKKTPNEDVFWFNFSINHVKKFTRIFEAITDYPHSLNGVYNTKINWDLYI